MAVSKRYVVEYREHDDGSAIMAIMEQTTAEITLKKIIRGEIASKIYDAILKTEEEGGACGERNTVPEH